MRHLTLLGLMISFLSLTAQEKEYVNAFKNKQLINAQTTIIPEGFDFTIMHRFGKIGLDDRIYKDFLGFVGWLPLQPAELLTIQTGRSKNAFCQLMQKRSPS